MAAPSKSPEDRRIAKLTRRLASIEKAIDKNAKNEDPAYMQKDLTNAGLHVDLWTTIRQIEHAKGAYGAAAKADERASEWSTRKKAASIALKNDMLPRILELLNAQENAASSLEGLE